MKRKFFMIALLSLAFLVGGACIVSATSDRALAKRWAKEHYPVYMIEFVKDGSKKIDCRAGKHIVYIEVIKSKSAGGYDGWSKRGGYVRYTKKVKKGKWSTSYAIWCPENNISDDVVAFVDHGKIRAETIIACPNCDGRYTECPYWLPYENRHMTEEEIKDFEASEMDR